MSAAVEADVDAVVPEPAPIETGRDAHRPHQIDRALLEHTGSHAIDDVLTIAVFDDDAVDAVEMEEMRKEQAGGTCSDDADLRFQKPALQTKFAASSVLPEPLYFATSGYWHSGRERVTAPV